jgi:hypothetical protein
MTLHWNQVPEREKERVNVRVNTRSFHVGRLPLEPAEDFIRVGSMHFQHVMLNRKQVFLLIAGPRLDTAPQPQGAVLKNLLARGNHLPLLPLC